MPDVDQAATPRPRNTRLGLAPEVSDVDRRRGVTPRVRLPRRHDLTVMELFAIEVRSALASALSSVDVLASEDLSLETAQRGRLLEAARRRLCHIQDVLEDVVDLDRLERAPSEAWQRVELAELVLSVAADEGGSERMRVSCQPVVVEADLMLLRRAVGNLLRNAVVHTPPGSRIEIRVEHDGEVARLVVDDDGPGIDERLRDRIFEPFDRGGAPALTPGLGLGLAVVRRIVTLHRGRVRAESSPLGGARLVLELPAVAVYGPIIDLGD